MRKVKQDIVLRTQSEALRPVAPWRRHLTKGRGRLFVDEVGKVSAQEFTVIQDGVRYRVKKTGKLARILGDERLFYPVRILSIESEAA